MCGPCSGHSDGGGGGGLEDSIKALTGEGEGEGERGPGLEAQGAACGGLMPTPGCLGVGETEQWPLGGIQPYSHTWMPAAPGALSKPWASPVPLPGERPAQRPTIQVRTGRWGGQDNAPLPEHKGPQGRLSQQLPPQDSPSPAPALASLYSQNNVIPLPRPGPRRPLRLVSTSLAPAQVGQPGPHP